MSDSWDISTTHSSTSTLLNLLSPADVEVIDDIVDRIPPDVGSFPHAFKAYGEVMRARGLDPESDVAYYRFLLKLSMLKGNWRDKWNAAKAGFDHQHTASSAGNKTPSSSSVLPDTWKPRAASPTPRPRRVLELADETATLTPPSSSAVRRWAPPEPAARLLGARSGAQDTKQRLQQLLRTIPAEGSPIPRSAKGKERETDPAPRTAITAKKVIQDEAAADGWREDVLMRRCWDTWRAGFLWIRNTGDQVHAAHGQLVVHKCLREWHKSYLRKQSLMERAAQIDDRNLLRRAMHAWVARCRDNLLRKMRVQEWRMDMRRRMAAVQSARRLRLMAQAFVTWHVIHLGLVWERHQNYTVAKNAFSAWRRHAQAKIAHLESIASQCTEILNHGRLVDFFERWRLQRELQSKRQQFEEWTGRGLLRQSIHTWREHTASRHEQRRADTVRRRAVLSSAFSKWRAALARNRSREHRAVRWSARSDKLLVISYAYCWIAREREQLLGRVRDARTTREYLGRWMAKLRRKRELEAHADAVARVHAAPLLRGTLTWWRTKLQKQQHAERFYAEYHAVNLMIRAFGKWERTLASRLQAEQQALHLRHQFLARRFVWRWREAVKKRKLRAAWRVMKRRHTQAWFERWLNMAQMNRVSRVLGDRRAMRSALSIWIGRVIALKERELDVQENRDRQLVTFFFDRWRDRFDKIQEDASLLENFVLIRQQKDMRDSFIRWNDAMHQRHYLRQAEEAIVDSVALTTVYTFWDKWRERFLEQRLQPLERQFQLQMQTNLRFFFFSRWYSKTSILPAIHFQVTSTKRRTWEKWRAAMAPALQMKQARELDRRTVLIKSFEKWQASYKAALRRRATAKRDWWLPTLHGSSMLSARPSPAAVSPFASSSSPATRFPVPPPRAPPSPSPPARPLTSLPLRPSLSDHIVNTPRRPRSMTAASSGSRPPAVTPTVFSRPLSRVGGIAASVTATSDSDGLWKQLRSERGLRGTRTDSRGGSPAP